MTDMDSRGKVVGTLSAGFHPNDFRSGGTPRTIAGPDLSDYPPPSGPLSTRLSVYTPEPAEKVRTER